VIILFIIFFREKPETPPSRLALVIRQLNPKGISEDIAVLFKSQNFILCAVAFTLLWGNYITFRNLLTPLFTSQFSSAEISSIGVTFVLFGAIGCYIMGVFLDKTKNFILAIRIVCIAVFVTFAASLILLPIGNFWISTSFAVFGGLFNVPILPAAYQYASLLTRKTPP